MDTKRIEFSCQSAETAAAPYCYLVAQTLLVSDMKVSELDPFASREGGKRRGRSIESSFSLDEKGVVTYNGLGLIGDRWRDVMSRRISSGYRIIIEDVGEFAISASGGRVDLLDRFANCARIILVESILGPPLILALALQGKFCLHAGAVVTAGRGVAFVAESGYGKSTLARFIGARPGGAALRMSDDILPLCLGSAQQLLALPHFPQLKLASGEQPLGTPAEVPLHTIYFLEKGKPGGEGAIEIHPMTRIESTLGLFANTVAARLFDQELLTNHLAFCAEAAARVRARRLSYPRTIDLLPVVEEVILADLEKG